MDRICLKQQREPNIYGHLQYTHNIEVSSVLFHLVIIALRAWLYYSHFILEKVEAERVCNLPKIKSSQG